MSTHTPIGRCCARPRFNAVGGLDERSWPALLAGTLRRKMRSLGGDREAAEPVELVLSAATDTAEIDDAKAA